MEVSEELKQLYKLIKELKEGNGADYHYLKFLVQSTERDAMYLLLKQLEKMEKQGYKFD